MIDELSITCPVCGRTSHNPNDVREGYCGNCHSFTGPKWDEQIRSFVVKRTDEWIVSVTPMIFNNRVLLTHVDEYPWSWTAGWCYDKGAAAFLAAWAWDLEVDREPVGYKKLVGDQRP